MQKALAEKALALKQQSQELVVSTETPVLISLNTTAAITSLSRTTINKKRAAGEFPRAVELGEKRIAFVRSEVENWIRDRIRARHPAEAA